MFEKLISLLPYNPGLLHQMSFYARRMRQEAQIRRTGLIFIVLAFMVQFFAVISPPVATTAASNNDLINGGFTSASEAARDCNSNLEDYATILKNYDISCKQVANSPTVSIKSTDHNRQLYSMGRLPYGLAGETPVNINGTTYYMRYLWSWDKGGPASTYQALRIIAGDGTLYYLLYNCGNFVSVGLPKPYVPTIPTPPKLKVIKTTLPGYPVENSYIAPGTTVGYRVYINNSGGKASDVKLSDKLPSYTTFQSLSLNAGAETHLYDSTSNSAEWSWGAIDNESGDYSVDLKLIINSNSPNGQKICNEASLSASGVDTITSNQVCMTVKINAPPPVVTTTSPSPSPSPTPPPAVCIYDSTIPANSPECKPCIYNNSITASNSLCKPCEQSLSSQNAIACITVHKTATNITQNVADANNTTANPGDVIIYTLYADNSGKASVDQFKFQENLSDVMDYASPTDLHGGTIDANDIVSWPSETIKANSTATHQITVKLKDPIPSTAPDPGDPGHFDFIMTNVYGNTININVPTPTTTVAETTVTNLPNTGPGLSMFIASAIIIVAGYFYSRARLLALESTIAVQENSGGLN